MLNVMLPYPVTTLDGETLLPANVFLSEKTAADVAAKGREKRQDPGCLLKHATIKTDLESFMTDGPYEFIFGGGADGICNHLEQIGKVPIPPPLLNALDNFRAHDYYTYRHSLTVFALTSFLMMESWPDGTIEKNALLVGPTHDLGKLFIPTDILHKKTPLTRQERNLLEFHTLAGYVMLSYYLGDHQHPAALVALNHHERRNGSGYPRGISNLDPIVEMVAACDVYDALISSRPYRETNYDNRTALEELTGVAEAGGLNWSCVQALIGRNRKGHPSPDKVDVSLDKRGTPPTGNSYALFAEALESNAG